MFAPGYEGENSTRSGHHTWFDFQGNVLDIRNSQVGNIVHELESFGVKTQVHDPLADPAAAWREYGIVLKQVSRQPMQSFWLSHTMPTKHRGGA